MPIAADTEEARVRQAYGARGDAGPAQAVADETAPDPGAQVGQDAGDLADVLVLGLLLERSREGGG
ncbi:hypothetical protein [Streptomyces sp. NEAU-NA10]|uniref:hypothetical protein n=1 Tax=Streptomyces sp. NEAU-NA10 TaxID=3416050 RepID=UPI003CC57CF0